MSGVATPATELLKVRDAASRLHLSESSVRRILAAEKTGVHRIFTPGRNKPMVRVEAQVIDRILRRSTQT